MGISFWKNVLTLDEERVDSYFHCSASILRTLDHPRSQIQQLSLIHCLDLEFARKMVMHCLMTEQEIHSMQVSSD